MKDFYNEWDWYAAEWIRNLQKAGHLPGGPVDERSITEITVQDLAGCHNAHFFAGIGGWPRALRLAGWPESRPVWTGSCPCQPFSTAGKARGVGDERHLWPAFLRLISEYLPPVIFGEQVESEDGRLWLAGVRVDLEKLGYAVGAADLCAAGVSAPHRRQRLYWVADRPSVGRDEGRGQAPERQSDASGRRQAGRLEHPAGERAGRAAAPLQGGNGTQDGVPGAAGAALRLGHADGEGQSERVGLRGDDAAPAGAAPGEATQQAGYWDAYDIAICTEADGPRARRIEPGTFPLVDGVPNRVGKLRAYGNAINPEVAAVFVRAYLDLHRTAGL
jgi:DNA (cytosine-5)-methyltransferase 1